MFVILNPRTVDDEVVLKRRLKAGSCSFKGDQYGLDSAQLCVIRSDFYTSEAFSP